MSVTPDGGLPAPGAIERPVMGHEDIVEHDQLNLSGDIRMIDRDRTFRCASLRTSVRPGGCGL